MQRSTTGIETGVVPIVDWVDVVDALRPFLANERTAMTFRFRGYLRPEGDVAGLVRAHDDRVEIRLDDARCLTAPDRSTRLRRLASCLSGWGKTVTVAAGDVVALQVPEEAARSSWRPRVVQGGAATTATASLPSRGDRAAARAAIERAIDDALGADRTPREQDQSPRRLRMTWWDARLKGRDGARPRLRAVGPLRPVGEDGPA